MDDPAVEPYSLRLVELDFDTKVDRAISLHEFAASTAAGRYVWIDVHWRDLDATRRLLAETGLLHDDAIEDALGGEPETRQARYEQHLHLVLSSVRPDEHELGIERVDVIIGERFLMTLHAGEPRFLELVRRDFRTDFVRFAKSPSFLVYELFDHLLDSYTSVQASFERKVDQIQSRLIGEVDQRTFLAVSELGSDLLNFRKILLPTRTLLTDLSSRKSVFISEATQPFLANMVGTVEHVLQELLVDRDILSESVNLYVSMVGHRTNETMKRLTVVSVVFLPLTFLVGVYGMNFEVFPEVHWQYGYAMFWVVALTIVLLIVVFMRRSRLL